MTTTDTAADLVTRITARLDDLAVSLAAGRSAELLAFLAFSARFYAYSLNNQLLIWCAAPDAQHVAGYHAWRDLGRQVRKGARAVRIVAPIVRKEEGEQQRRVVGYRAACVFADFDTEGEALPGLRTLTGGDPETLAAVLAACPYPVQITDQTGAVRGQTDGQRIQLHAPACGSLNQQTQTVIHEWAHCLLHFAPDAPESERPSLAVCELEADAIAYTVAAFLGIDATAKTTDYIHTWGGNASILRASLGRITRASASIMTALTEPPSANAA